MYSVVTTAIVHGIDSIEVSVEADICDGMPMFEMVGLLGSEVKEARERVRTALRNCGYVIPAKRITVNLSPADLRKSGAAFDLPIAVAILGALGVVKRDWLTQSFVAGEVSLRGDILPVEGVLPMVAQAKKNGKKYCIVATGNRQEASLIHGIEIWAVQNLHQVIQLLNGQRLSDLEENSRQKNDISEPADGQDSISDGDFSEINGQQFLKRVCEVAVSGMHSLLMSGPPGAGKTMVAKRMAGILPPLTEEERLEISKIYSVCGMLKSRNTLIDRRPFRSPHHTISPQGLVGGGRYPKPGEITLAHRGVLFLDEMTEFDKHTLDILRQPLEEREIHLVRLNGKCIYPADFLLVAAMNPCNCGYYPDRTKCRCSERQIRQYLNKISGPLLDRMDLCVEVKRMEYGELIGRGDKGDSSAVVQSRVKRVHEIQQERFRDTGILFNSRIPAAQLEKYCYLGSEQSRYMEEIYRKYELSARGYHKILKVARTLADMDGCIQIERHHLSEAVCYRSFDKKLWER